MLVAWEANENLSCVAPLTPTLKLPPSTKTKYGKVFQFKSLDLMEQPLRLQLNLEKKESKNKTKNHRISGQEFSKFVRSSCDLNSTAEPQM